MWDRVLLCVQRNFLLRLRFGMKDDTGSLQFASRSWILGRVSFNCLGQCTVDSFVSRSQSCGPRSVAFQQAFNSPPTHFAVSLLSPLTSSQVPAPWTNFTETPLFEVCSAKVGPRYCSPSKPRPGDEAPSQRGSPFRLECRMNPETTEQLAF